MKGLTLGIWAVAGVVVCMTLPAAAMALERIASALEVLAKGVH